MKRLAFVIGLLTFAGAAVQAQQQYFLFILADNQQPFYVRMGEKTYSSSVIGHLVIPRLKDSTYYLTVGFPRKQYPEQSFALTPNGKDHDYRLRNMAGDGWHLVNEQTAQTVKPRKDEVVKNTPALGERKTGAFAVLMSGLVNDSAVMYKSVAKVEVPAAPPVVAAPTPEQTIAAPATVTPVSATQTESGNATTQVTIPPPTTTTITTTGEPAAATDSVKTAAVPRSVILDVQEWWNEKGKGYIYYDSTLVGVDTISILVEYGPPKMINPNQAVDRPAKQDSAQLAITEVPATQPATIAATDSVRKQTDSSLANTTEKIAPTVAPVVKSVADSTTKSPVIIADAATAKPATDKADSSRTTVSNNTIDSAQLAQATAAGNAKVDSVKAITGAPVKEPEVTGELPRKDSAKAATTTAATEVPRKESVKTTETAANNTATAEKTREDSIKAAAESKKQLLLMNSDCVNFATETDVDKLRVKMLNTTDIDDRITAAKKVFKTKCFVTRYIRGLSELFPNDEARFRFFDAAYPFVSDSGHFRTLIDLFTEELWIARFKALVRM